MLDEHSRLILNSHDWHAINLVCAWARLISGVNRSFNSGLAKNLPGLQIRSYRPMRSQSVVSSNTLFSQNIRSNRFQKVGRIRTPFVARNGAASGSPKVGTIQPTDWN